MTLPQRLEEIKNMYNADGVEMSETFEICRKLITALEKCRKQKSEWASIAGWSEEMKNDELKHDDKEIMEILS